MLEIHEIYSLHGKVMGGDLNALSLHLDQGGCPDLKMPTGAGETLAMSACRRQANAPLVERLALAGADFSIQNSEGWNAAMIAVIHGSGACLASAMAAGCPLDARDRGGNDLAMLASMYCRKLLPLIELEPERRALELASMTRSFRDGARRL